MTDLEQALAAGAKPVKQESDLDRALKAGAKRVELPQRPPGQLPDSLSGNSEPGFFAHAGRSIRQGAHSVATVGKDLVTHPVDTLRNPAKRHEFERGLDDIVTLGYGQRLAARIGNAAGDVERGTSLNETRHFSADPTQGAGAPVASRVEAADAADAPGYRTTAQLMASLFGAGAGGALAKGGARVAQKTLGRVATSGAGASAAMGMAKGLGAYEATAPITAALGADAEGDRLGAATQAAQDPLGLILSGGGGALAEGAKHKVMASKGAQARRYIEERGGEVGVTTPGRGGPYEQMPSGTTDADIGAQSQRSAVDVTEGLKTYRNRVASEPYQEAISRVPDEAAAARVDITPVYDRLVKAYAHPGTAPDVAMKIKHQLDILERYYRDRSEPAHGDAPKTLVDQAPAGRAPQEPAPTGGTKNERPGRAPKPAAKPKLAYDDILQQWLPDDSPYAPHPEIDFHDVAGMPEGRAPSPPLKMQFDKTAAGPAPTLPPEAPDLGGRVSMTHEELNGLRQALAGLGQVGESTKGKLTPLQDAYRVAKELVDQGPYAEANRLYSAGTADANESLGLLDLKRKFVPGTPTSDVNKVRVKAGRMGQNTITAGADRPKIDKFSAKHPDLALELEKPELLRKKADLSFRFAPQHGGLIERTAGAAAGPAAMAIAAGLGHGTAGALSVGTLLALQNAQPIAGRLLYPVAQKLRAEALGSRLALPQAMRAAQEAKRKLRNR